MIIQAEEREPVFENELINIPKNIEATVFKAVTSSGDFLPRIQLMTAGSAQCKSGEFPINHYAVVDNQVMNDVGKDVDVLVLDWRPKAVQFDDEIIVVYDTELPMFKQIQEKSGQKDSGCMFGPEFLLYLPNTNEFVTFFMGSKSARREAPALNAHLHKAATLMAKKIETSKYTWYAPQVVACTTPFDIPEEAEVLSHVEKFRNPVNSELEEAESESSTRER